MADAASTESLITIGDNYRDGKGVASDPQKALEYYRLAAERGDATGFFKIGVLYHYGLGFAPNFQLAKQQYEEAKKRGNILCIINLGNLYEVQSQIDIKTTLIEGRCICGSIL